MRNLTQKLTDLPLRETPNTIDPNATAPKEPAKRLRPDSVETPRPGPRLKHARLVKSYTLKQLADIVGCSESMISKLENGKLAPSISLLHRLATALDTSIAELFLENESATSALGVTVFPAERRTRFEVEPRLEQVGSWFERILPIHRSGLLQANILNVPKGVSSTSFVEHEGEEFGYMIEGELEVIVNQTSHFLRKGDVIYFPSSLPHGYRNESDGTAQILWINTPPTL